MGSSLFTKEKKSFTVDKIKLKDGVRKRSLARGGSLVHIFMKKPNNSRP